MAVGLVVVAGVLGALAKVSQWASRRWTEPLSFLEAVALWIVAVPIAIASALFPPAGPVLVVAAIAGGGAFVRRRQNTRPVGPSKTPVAIWLGVLLMTALVPWLTADSEEDSVRHPLFVLIYLAPLAFSAFVVVRAEDRRVDKTRRP